LKGLANMRDEAQTIHFEATDYADRFQSEQTKNKQQAEEIAALKAQVEAMGGGRPRPPRPPLN